MLHRLSCFGAIIHRELIRWSDILVLSLCYSRYVASITVDTCPGYEFHASCRPDEIIVMQSAEFGRMSPGTCVSADRGNFGCKNDVLFLADMWCSGRKDCQFNVPNVEIMEANTECVDVLPFLRASYSCMPTATVPHNGPSCVLSSHSSEGVISSQVPDVNGCGSARSPWSIEARAGQTVELSLLDFEALNRARHYSLSMCYQVYGFVVEKTLNINYTICGQQIRDSVIYRSNTNRIQLHLKYQLIGCPDPKPPPYAWYKRNGNEAVLGCETSDKEWRLTCTANRWIGKSGNCTVVVATTGHGDGEYEVRLALSTIVMVAGIIGSTVVLAVTVIVCGVVYIHKYRSRHERKYNEIHTKEDILPVAEVPKHMLPHNDTDQEQDNYLQPNFDDKADGSEVKAEKTLVHIWETPLPDPEHKQVSHQSRDCTIPRLPPTQQNVNNAKHRNEPGHCTTSARHKYCVLHRES